MTPIALEAGRGRQESRQETSGLDKAEAYETAVHQGEVRQAAAWTHEARAVDAISESTEMLERWKCTWPSRHMCGVRLRSSISELQAVRDGDSFVFLGASARRLTHSSTACHRLVRLSFV